MVGQITSKIFDHPIEKDCVSDLSDPGSCRIGPVRQDAGPENAAFKNLAAVHEISENIRIHSAHDVKKLSNKKPI